MARPSSRSAFRQLRGQLTRPCWASQSLMSFATSSEFRSIIIMWVLPVMPIFGRSNVSALPPAAAIACAHLLGLTMRRGHTPHACPCSRPHDQMRHALELRCVGHGGVGRAGGLVCYQRLDLVRRFECGVESEIAALTPMHQDDALAAVA